MEKKIYKVGYRYFSKRYLALQYCKAVYSRKRYIETIIVDRDPDMKMIDNLGRVKVVVEWRIQQGTIDKLCHWVPVAGTGPVGSGYIELTKDTTTGSITSARSVHVFNRTSDVKKLVNNETIKSWIIGEAERFKETPDTIKKIKLPT